MSEEWQSVSDGEIWLVLSPHSMMAARRGAPPLASIESLLSFEAKSTPRSEYGLSGLPGLPLGVELGGGLGRSESVLPVESFQVLSGDQQTEEIFKLLSLLSPFAGEVSIQRLEA